MLDNIKNGQYYMCTYTDHRNGSSDEERNMTSEPMNHDSAAAEHERDENFVHVSVSTTAGFFPSGGFHNRLPAASRR